MIFALNKMPSATQQADSPDEVVPSYAEISMAALQDGLSENDLSLVRLEAAWRQDRRDRLRASGVTEDNVTVVSEKELSCVLRRQCVEADIRSKFGIEPAMENEGTQFYQEREVPPSKWRIWFAALLDGVMPWEFIGVELDKGLRCEWRESQPRVEG